MLAVKDIAKLSRRFDARRVRYRPVGLPEMMEILKGVPADQPALILTRVEAKDVPASNPFGRLYKVGMRVVTLNKPYEEAVNERRAVERKKADFVASSRSWGAAVSPPFVLHQMDDLRFKVYLSLIVEKDVGEEYVTEDMMPVPLEKVEEYTDRKKYALSQGLRKGVKYRNYDVNNVLAICVTGPRGGLLGYVLDLDRKGDR